MKDNYNRNIKHIRFSITSKCQYSCLYCDSEGYSRTHELTVEEITKLCKILAEILDVTRIKFTGGEPLCREEIVQIIQNVSDLQLYKDISMTTNGLLLSEKAEDGKKRALFILNNFLTSVGWNHGQIEKRLKVWNKKNPEPLREVILLGQLRYRKQQKQLMIC